MRTLVTLRFVRITTPLIVLAALVLLASPAALAQGRDCPVDQGACFFELPEGDFVLLWEPGDGDGDGDEDFLFMIVDGFSDFLTFLPKGRVRVHINEPNAVLTYCPFALLEFPPPVTDECVFGGGHLTANGFAEGPLGLCGGAIQVQGSGLRGTDGEEFEFSARLVVNGQCNQVQFFIADNVP